MSVLMPEHRERVIATGEDWKLSATGVYLPAVNPAAPTAMDLFARGLGARRADSTRPAST